MCVFTLSPFSLKGECHGPDGQPGYKHVRKLAMALVEARDLPGLSDRRVDRLTELWHRLPEYVCVRVCVCVRV